MAVPEEQFEQLQKVEELFSVYRRSQRTLKKIGGDVAKIDIYREITKELKETKEQLNIMLLDTESDASEEEDDDLEHTPKPVTIEERVFQFREESIQEVLSNKPIEIKKALDKMSLPDLTRFLATKTQFGHDVVEAAIRNFSGHDKIETLLVLLDAAYKVNPKRDLKAELLSIIIQIKQGLLSEKEELSKLNRTVGWDLGALVIDSCEFAKKHLSPGFSKKLQEAVSLWVFDIREDWAKAEEEKAKLVSKRRYKIISHLASERGFGVGGFLVAAIATLFTAPAFVNATSAASVLSTAGGVAGVSLIAIFSFVALACAISAMTKASKRGAVMHRAKSLFSDKKQAKINKIDYKHQ